MGQWRRGGWFAPERLVVLRWERRCRHRIGGIAQPCDERTRRRVVGLSRQNALQGLHGALTMALRSVDFRKRDRGKSGGSAGASDGQRNRGYRSNPVRCVGQVQPSLDHAREQVARSPEKATRSLFFGLIRGTAQQQLVDELGTGQDARAGHAYTFRPRDESVPVEAFQVRAVHGMGYLRHRARGRRDPSVADRLE